MNLPLNVYWACLSVLLGIALSRGGRPEQFAALLIAGASALSLAAAPDPDTSFRTVEWDIFVIDVTSLTGFVALSLNANRWWPMCIAGLKLIPVAAHLSKWLVPAIHPLVYMWVTGAFSYVYMIVIAAGAARHQARLRRHGNDLAWRRGQRFAAAG